jgi:hypothetical protein
MCDDAPLSRRHFLWQSGGGLGAIALAWMEARAQDRPDRPLFPSRAKRIVQVFAAGGVSHVDTFDYKPELEKHDGQALSGKGKVDTFFGRPGNLLKSPFAFRPRGESGLLVSDLLPEIASCADELCIVRSMVSKNNNHTPATFLMNSGFTMTGFPSIGAWVSYGLGCETDDLPAFVVLPDPRGEPAGGSANWSAGFLPAAHQGVAFSTRTAEPVKDLAPPASADPAARAAGLELALAINREDAARNAGDAALGARLRSYELAGRMQVRVPEAADLSGESGETRRLYGLDRKESEGFGRNCLLARRLLERGVRFVQLFHGGAFGGNPRINWDGHEDVVANHTLQASSLDRPLAGLLRDLRRRGMLDDTLVLFSTEFGRTPMTEGVGTRGRDHHPHAFSCWMAGGGVRRGVAFGASDEVGYHAVENPVTTYDLHATILRLLGLDHTKLTFYHNGIRRRLTDVHGHVVEGLLA